MIKYLRHNEIDKDKWDVCISNAFNGRVYGCSWYLDIMAPGWQALIEGDYERVMPLTWNRKFNIKYVYQPFYTQQLGIFSSVDKTPFPVDPFLAAIPKSFCFTDINLNTGNTLETKDGFKQRTTQELPLLSDFDSIKKKMSRNNKNNIKKAENNKIQIQTNKIDPHKLINLIATNYREKGIQYISGKIDFNKIKKIIKYAVDQKYGIIYNSINSQQQVNCAALFIFFNGKARIFSGQNAKGKDENAKYLLINQFIKDHAGTDITLDFGGSEIPGVAYWNEGFGAVNTHYYHIKINRLPFFIRWLKK